MVKATIFFLYLRQDFLIKKKIEYEKNQFRMSYLRDEIIYFFKITFLLKFWLKGNNSYQTWQQIVNKQKWLKRKRDSEAREIWTAKFVLILSFFKFKNIFLLINWWYFDYDNINNLLFLCKCDKENKSLLYCY